jgi:hypothetical protein
MRGVGGVRVVPTAARRGVMRVMAVVRMVAVVGVVRVMPGCGRRGVTVRQREQWRCRDPVGAAGHRRLRSPDAEPGVGDLRRGALGKHRREGYPEWDEKWLLFHDPGDPTRTNKRLSSVRARQNGPTPPERRRRIRDRGPAACVNAASRA